MVTLGACSLRTWREESGYSQLAAARALDVSQGAYCDWETGKKTPRLKGLLKIEETVGIPPSAFTRPAQGADDVHRGDEVKAAEEAARGPVPRSITDKKTKERQARGRMRPAKQTQGSPASSPRTDTKTTSNPAKPRRTAAKKAA